MLTMMDNNDNENYCYQQPHIKTGNAVNKGAIPKANVFKYQNQFNNNNNIAEQENLMPQVNVPLQICTATSECNGTIASGSEKNETIASSPKTESEPSFLKVNREGSKAEDPYSNDDLIAKSINEEEVDPDEDSDNNSIGNLSYISDNGLIEEIILLPNNIYSDDENGSASDDCIYAYRGDDNVPALLEYREQPADDETDFLEMDFDPEPSSELENLLELPEIESNSFQTVGRISRQDLKSPVKSPNFDQVSPCQLQCERSDETGDDFAPAVPALPTEAKKTGAIPKKLSTYSQQSTIEARDYEQAGPSKPTMKANSKNLTLDLKLCTDMRGSMDHRYHYSYFDESEYIADDDEDACCLDCTKKTGLLMQTKQDLSRQKVCRSCHSRSLHYGAAGGHSTLLNDFFSDVGQSLNTSNSEADLMSVRAEQIVLQALNKINELKATPPSMGLSKSMEDLCVELEADQRDQEVPDDFAQELCDNTVTIYTMNCGELTIIEALTRIGVAPNLDILRQYFNERYTVDTGKMSIPQYLLYMSKRDCNFKKLIEAIKSCCDEPLDVQYYPLDPFSDIPEVVPINSTEITKRWNSNTNLRQIINFRHKHFHTLNVLGKIVNILRQPSRGRHANQIINIPQYYKSGSITITRIT